jgi:hypothetical protein
MIEALKAHAEKPDTPEREQDAARLAIEEIETQLRRAVGHRQ